MVLYLCSFFFLATNFALISVEAFATLGIPGVFFPSGNLYALLLEFRLGNYSCRNAIRCVKLRLLRP